MSAAEDVLYLARCEQGGACKAFPIDPDWVRLPDHNKDRATILRRKPRAWLFDAKRTSLGRQLCLPGAAAIDYTEPAAVSAAMALMAQYNAVRLKR